MTGDAASAAIILPRGWWRVATLALVLYVGFLVASAPASLLSWALSLATNGVLVLERPQGGAWQGNADALAVTDRSRRVHRYERLRWDFLGSRLFRGEIAARVQIEDPNLRGAGKVALTLHRVRLSEAAFESPAASLIGYFPALALGKLSGTLSLNTAEFVLGRDDVAGEATIAWRNAGSALTNVSPLGEYVARVTGAAKRAEIRVDTIEGVLRIEGRGKWSLKEGLLFDGTARAAPQHQADLAELLKLLGPDRGGAVHQIKITASANYRAADLAGNLR